MADKNLGHIRYTTLCDQGTKTQQQIARDLGRMRTVAYHLMDAETNQPHHLPHYQTELADLKANIHRSRGNLMRHVAHCTDGCIRDTTGGLSGSAFTNHGAPAHAKPALPKTTEIAARLRDGEALEAIAAQYDRRPDALRLRLNHAGFSSTTGKPMAGPAPKKQARLLQQLVGADEPWRDDALCAQTDPEAFFPDQGGSTRAAKAMCQTCDARTQCLQAALDRDERFGIWGGLSERERRPLAREQKAS